MENISVAVDWISFLACPKCGMILTPISSPAGQAASPQIECRKCSRRFPIRGGVPVLLETTTAMEAKTQELYGDIWDNYHKHKQRRPARGYHAPATSHLELLRLASGADLARGEVGIDAGCGTGGGTIAMAAQHPSIRFIGIDLAPGVFHAAELAKNLSNVCFVQGNLVALPLARRVFDFVYSFGVLHHTSDPRAAFQALVERLRPGGRITIFVYKDFSDLPLKKWLLAPITLARRLTTKLPATMLRNLSWLGAPLVFIGLTLPARFLRRIGLDRFARHIPYGTFPSIYGIASSLQDRFGAPYEHRFSLRDLEGWAHAARLTGAKAVDCLAWGFSGLVLTGCAPYPDATNLPL